MLIQVQTQIIPDQRHIFQGTYFQNFQIHLQAVMYEFQHIIRDILHDFFISNTFHTFWACA